MNGPWHYMEGERLLYLLSTLDDEDPAVWPAALRAQAHMQAAAVAADGERIYTGMRVRLGGEWREAFEYNPMICHRSLPDAAGICGNDVEPGKQWCDEHECPTSVAVPAEWLDTLVSGGIADTEPSVPLTQPIKPSVPNATEAALAESRRTGWVDEPTGLISGGLVTDDEPGGSR